MSRVLEILSKCWTWFYDRTVVWIIVLFILLFSWGTLENNKLDVQVNKEDLSCRTKCLPQSSEFFQGKQGIQCWCYKDVNTLVKTN
jgi:hypothetical protein|tara:strand:- start:118 stop:375 length:258 start_codon:yes stop_codon:yes gene_type:complete